MKKDKIIEALNDWNFWRKIPNTGFARKYYIDKMKAYADTEQVVVLTGVRRAGKSTLMLQYIGKLKKEGIEPQDTLYVNFEDPRFYDELSLKLLQDIYEAYFEKLEPKGTPYIFLDEIQHIPAWEKFVRSLHERKEATIFVSGSNSKLLSDEFGSSLTGRHLMINVFPLNFKEFLHFNGLEIKNELDLIAERIKIKRLLRNYLEFGGFPKVVLSAKEKQEILLQYFVDIITRDIVERHKIRKPDKLRALAKYYLTNNSSLITFNSIRKYLELPLDTVERFSYFLEAAYMVFFNKKFAYSLKEQEVNPRKVYAIDTGIRNVVSFRFSEDIGRLYENMVFLHLKQTKREIFYWKNKAECDFMVKDGNNLQAIQVTYDFEDRMVKEREIKGLISVLKEFNLKSGLIITEDSEGEEQIEGKDIRFMPLWKWLLI